MHREKKRENVRYKYTSGHCKRAITRASQLTSEHSSSAGLRRPSHERTLRVTKTRWPVPPFPTHDDRRDRGSGENCICRIKLRSAALFAPCRRVLHMPFQRRTKGNTSKRVPVDAKMERRMKYFTVLDKHTREGNLQDAVESLRCLKKEYELDENEEYKKSSQHPKLPIGRYLQVLSLCKSPKCIKQLESLCKEIRETYGEDQFFVATSDLLVKIYAEYNLQKAIQLLEEMQKRGHTLKRRSFGPIIVACCRAKDSTKAFKLYFEAKAKDIEFTEVEFSELVHLCTHLNLGTNMSILLKDISTTLSVLPRSLLNDIKEWFRQNSYEILENLSPDLEGKMIGATARAALDPYRLSNDVTDYYLQQILTAQTERKKSRRKEKIVHKKIQKFLLRLARDGGAEVWIDGANVGHFEMGGAFSYQQVDEVYNHFLRCGYRTRIVLHHSRCHGLPDYSAENKIVRRWISHSALYITPNGVNDDAYWLYGALWSTKTLPEVYIVTNDLGRDHQYQFGHDKRFFRFIQSHVIRFAVKNVDTKCWKEMSENVSEGSFVSVHQKEVRPIRPIAVHHQSTSSELSRRQKINDYISPHTRPQPKQTYNEKDRRAYTPNRYFAQIRAKCVLSSVPVQFASIEPPLPRVQTYTPGRYMRPEKLQPVPLGSQPVPYFKLRHLKAPNVFPLEYHYPFTYSIAPQMKDSTWFLPFMVNKKMECKDLYKNETGDAPPIPTTVAKRVLWVVCRQIK
mmetsp:Transcript_21681/g.34971  ORF Transcript_21681/g.34971 Transcript_21681/m.34971 type:complete len:737 (+) Transcript_21681:33-2243(+)